MTPTKGIVFLLDVDNTLLDNDQFERELRGHLERELGVECQARYWEIFEELRAELGYADYLGAVQRLRLEDLHDQRRLRISSFLLDYPFADRLYPGALEVIARLRGWGPTVILSDGDAVFQPRKIERSGLFQAVDGNVVIYLHKDHELKDIETRYAADHYVLVDDKPGILSAVKNTWGARLTTIFPRQGHYAHDPKNSEKYAPADISIERIADIMELDLSTTTAVNKVDFSGDGFSVETS